LQKINLEWQNAFHYQWREEQLSHEALSLSDKNNRIIFLIFMLDDPNQIQQLVTERAANSERIGELIGELEPVCRTEEEKELLDNVKATRKPYLESYEKALSLLLTDHKKDAARQMMLDDLGPKLTAYHEAWNDFDQFQVSEISRVMQQSKVDYISTQQAFVLSLVLAGLLTSAIAVFALIRMNREITVRQRAEQNLQQSYAQVEQRVQDRTADLKKANEVLQTEVTDRKRAEEQLRESERKFRLLTENIGDVFWMASADHQTVHHISRAYEVIWGHSKESLYANPRQWHESIIPEDRERVLATFAPLLDSQPTVSMEYQIAQPDGTIRWIHDRGFQIRDAGGKLIHLAGIASDITDRKRIEARLFQSQKMETVGKLAGGVAHEFNSILTAIIGQSEYLLGELPEDDPLAKSAQEIRMAADRAATLTRQLLAYGRKQILEPESLNLNRVLGDMVNTLQHLVGPDIDVRTVPAIGLKKVRIDPGQIEQVIVSLAMNAADAMPNGGRLTLETANVILNEEFVQQVPGLKAGSYVQLAISDTGVGMSEEVKARVFEPFFSTKDVGHGVGLGLATCYGIVKQSDGHIAVYSELGRGTTVKIYLRESSSRTTSVLPRIKSPDMPTGTETILLAEDDPSLLEMAATLLRRLGYNVLTAVNGIEAMSLKQQKDIGHIDLLLTDVVMPHMSGKELSDRIRAIYPHTRILFTSAYTENAIVHQGVLSEGVVLLPKPFTPTALANKVREVLDQKSALK